MIVDAGAEPWERVQPLLNRRINELPAAGVLELLSIEPSVGEAVALWCAQRGHTLDIDVQDDATPVLRIHKGRHSPA